LSPPPFFILIPQLAEQLYVPSLVRWNSWCRPLAKSVTILSFFGSLKPRTWRQ
jgi:hypothetical protein